ncbi:hypothetical protein RKD48_002702 [Streptomyces ambofaciens]
MLCESVDAFFVVLLAPVLEALYVFNVDALQLTVDFAFFFLQALDLILAVLDLECGLPQVVEELLACLTEVLHLSTDIHPAGFHVGKTSIVAALVQLVICRAPLGNRGAAHTGAFLEEAPR